MITIAEEIYFIQNLIKTLDDGEKRFSLGAYEFTNSWFSFTPDMENEFDASYGSKLSVIVIQGSGTIEFFHSFCTMEYGSMYLRLSYCARDTKSSIN